MESIEQPIFSTLPSEYLTDDKQELIDEEPRGRKGKPVVSSDSTDSSPVNASKGLLTTGSHVLTDHGKGFWIIIICTIIFAIIVTIALLLTIFLMPKKIEGHAAVATDVPECSRIGLGIIQLGGNAVDAAVSAAFCLSVVHAMSTGIGGGGFLLYHDHKNIESWAYDFRETAPQAAKPDIFTDPNLEVSGKSVGVPGFLKGLEQVHKELGSMSWKELLQPAIDLALKGFNVTIPLAEALKEHIDREMLPGGAENGILKLYYKQGGFVTPGDIVSNDDLARTLQEVASKGSSAFYFGKLGENFIASVTKYNGMMTKEDLHEYAVIKQKPIISHFKGFKVLGMPAPSSGPVVALILNLINGFNWTQESKSETYVYHQLIEAFKFGYAYRSLLGDPSDLDHKRAIENATEMFLSEEFAASLREKITDKAHHQKDYYGPTLTAPSNMGTTHLSVIDTHEVMVSLTLTLNLWFGSKIMTSDGILANNEMLDFSQSNGGGSVVNSLKADKRPLSSMSPTIIYDEDSPCAKRIAIGASNNTRIITGIVQTIVNTAVFGMNLTEAIAYPRLHQQLYPSDVTEYEDVASQSAPSGRVWFSHGVVDNLVNEFGQKMSPVDEGLSTVQGVMKVNDAVEAYSDWRKFGKAAEF